MPHAITGFRTTLTEQAPLLAGGAACLLAWAYLAQQSTAYGAATLADLLFVSTVCFAASVALWWWYGRTAAKLSVPVLLALAVLLRVIAARAFPVLEDDFYRYLWDGRMVVEYGDPYGLPPAAFFDVEHLPEPFERILDAINYPTVATVYGPTAQWLFAAAYVVAPGEPAPLQWAAAGADVALLVALLRLAPARHCVLYALSPLVLKEFANCAHIDVYGALLIVLALLAVRHQRWWLAGVLLGVAIGVKPFALLVAPFLLGFRPQAWLACVGVALLLALPFGLGQAWLPPGLQAMSVAWLFNAPLYYVIQALWGVGALGPAKLIALVAYAAVWLHAYLLWTRSTVAPTALPHWWLVGVFLLLLPVLNPWYLVWWLPFAVLRPTATAWVASFALLLSYVSGINLATEGVLAPYAQPWWALATQFGLIALALLCDLKRARLRNY